MARTVERIEQELAALDRAVAVLAQEFYDTYTQYLQALTQAVRQQVILASYHLCTHGYPEQFLRLSLQQRQQLQHALRQLAKESQTELLDCLMPITPRRATQSKRSLISRLKGARLQADDAESALSVALGLEQDIALVLETEEMDNEEEDLDNEEMETEEMETEEIETEAGLLHPDTSTSESPQAIDGTYLSSSYPEPHQASYQDGNLGDSSPEGRSMESQTLDEQEAFTDSQSDQAQSEQADEQNPVPQRPVQPKDILLWHEDLEEEITEQLQELSHAANRLLQRAKVLPSHLPEPVLEVAARADLATESAVSPPNLLNLIIETENEEDKETSMTQVMAIRLRLSEIEFGDTAATVWRSKIRDLLGQLSKLGRNYQKKQKERSVAQAEAAWRSSWYDD
ncbi:MAG TPA: hypothetical protein V6C65_16400 [Allocoleopsis sp.]